MITIKFEFDYDGKHHKLCAYLKDDMTLSNCKKNENVELIESCGDKSQWHLLFFCDDEYDIEVKMRRNEVGIKTCEAVGAIVWSGDDRDRIEDDFYVESKVSRR